LREDAQAKEVAKVEAEKAKTVADAAELQNQKNKIENNIKVQNSIIGRTGQPGGNSWQDPTRNNAEFEIKQLNKALDDINRKISGTTSSSTTHQVNININGKNTPVNVSSEYDAKNLIAALQRAQQTSGM
jgi:hypothetical protein